jgi:hypothetical protein
LSGTKRKLYLILGMVAATWLTLLISSYGVLVHSALIPQVVTLQKEFSEGTATLTLRPDVLRCTYFIATSFRSVDYALIDRTRCPRLWNFSG